MSLIELVVRDPFEHVCEWEYSLVVNFEAVFVEEQLEVLWLCNLVVLVAEV